jgi:hypothetical protein
MAMLINQIITAAGAGQVGPVYRIRGGPGSAQLPDVIFFQANFTYGSGGTSVDVYVQTSFDGELTWCDVVHFAQMTTSNARYICSVQSAAGVALATPTDGTLAVATMNAGVFDRKWRVKYSVVGT